MDKSNIIDIPRSNIIDIPRKAGGDDLLGVDDYIDALIKFIEPAICQQLSLCKVNGEVERLRC